MQSATFIAGIFAATVTGRAVVVNGDGQLGVAPSSKRFKNEIKPMDKASESNPRPQTGYVSATRERSMRIRTPQFGLVAEEVEKVNPDLVVRDKEGKTIHRSLRSGERHVAQ